MNRTAQALFLVALAAGTPVAALAQNSDAASAERLECTVIGASLSNGTSLKMLGVMLGLGDMKKFAKQTLNREISDFELRVRTDSIGVRALLRKIANSDRVSLKDCSDTMFFRSPQKNGEKQLARAKRRKGLVLGLDFMFWFGYGGVPYFGGRADATDRAVLRALRRLEKQEQGFRLLETHLLDTGSTIILGDYPNMTGAVERMLPKSAVPRAVTIAELNRRLYAWAADKPQVHIFPIAARMAQARAGKMKVPGTDEVLRLDQLLQLDRLHPTKLGMAVIATDLLVFLRKEVPAIAARLDAKSELTAILAALQQSSEWQRRAELRPPNKTPVGK